MKTLLYDIETMANRAYVWGKYEQDVIAYEQEGYMLSFSAKWLDGKQITRGLPDYKGYKPGKPDDLLLLLELHKLISEADIVIAHNGDRFDIRKMNARFIYHGLNPPAPYKSVDTLKVAKKYFAFNSNKLDDLGAFLGVGRKVKHPGFDLWLGCEAGDTASWNLMKRYNKQDVILLEEVYKKLRPWHTGHPATHNCEEYPIKTTRSYMTIRGPKTRGQCSECGLWRNIKQETNVPTRKAKPARLQVR